MALPIYTTVPYIPLLALRYFDLRWLHTTRYSVQQYQIIVNLHVYACTCICLYYIMCVHMIMSIHIELLPRGEISMVVFIGMHLLKCVARAVWDFEVQWHFEENSDRFNYCCSYVGVVLYMEYLYPSPSPRQSPNWITEYSYSAISQYIQCMIYYLFITNFDYIVCSWGG